MAHKCIHTFTHSNKSKKTASILSGDVIMQMVAEQIRVKALPIMIDKLQYQSFHDLESAEEWIFEIS
ncbi:hypothetical protein GCM10028895_17080 [Pontibacter rugosus]